MLDRCAGKAGATESAIGWLPRPADLDTRGLNLGADALAALLTVDAGLWRKEVTELREYLGKFGSRLPAALLAEGTRRRQSDQVMAPPNPASTQLIVSAPRHTVSGSWLAWKRSDSRAVTSSVCSETMRAAARSRTLSSGTLNGLVT